MEEIEYLEEYEDFILPSDNNCTGRLSADRTSMDSLDGIYKELIADSSLALAEEPTMSQFSVKPNTIADITSPISKLSVGLLPKALQSPKSSTNPAPPNYMSTITTIEPPKTPAYKLSTFNRNNSSVLQRSDKLKSVATVKPTLQRVNNPAKQSIRNNTPPLKSNTMGQSFQASPLLSSTAQSVVANVPKSSAQSKNAIAVANPFHGSGVDPLSLDDDGFLNFDVDKHGLVDDFDFDSDLDNSIIGGISDLDSVDFSDEFSEGNFDLDSDMSSASSDGKKRVKKKRQELSTKNPKNRPGASTAKQEQAKDRMSPNQSKRPQQFKVGAKQQNLSQLIGGDKRTDQPAVGDRNELASAKSHLSNKKDISIRSPTPRTNQPPVSNDRMPKLQTQQSNIPNAFKEKISHTVASSNTTAIAATVAAATNVTVATGSPISKADLDFLDAEFVSSGKRENDKTYVNKKRLSNNEDTAKPNEPISDNTIKKFVSEPSSLKSPPAQHNTEHANNRGAATPDKNVRIKFGSMCLKSIKPPVCKDLILKKIPHRDVSTASPQPGSIVNRILQTDAPIALQQSELIVKEVPENDAPFERQRPDLSVKRIPHDATDIVAKSTPEKDTPIIPQQPDCVVKKIPQIDIAIVAQHPDLVETKVPQTDTPTVQQHTDLVVKKTPQRDEFIFPQLPDLVVKKIPQKDASIAPQQSDLVEKKTPQKDAPTVAEQSSHLAGLSQPLIENQEVRERNILTKTIPELDDSIPCTENKITFVADSKSVQSNTINNDSTAQKSTSTQESEKVTHRNTKELESSEKLTRQSLKSLKGVPADSGNKQLPGGISNQCDVVADSERVVFSTAASPQKRFGRITKLNNRWKENIQKIQQKESTIDNKKTSTLPYKFQARSFNVRLNRKAVAKFLRSPKVAVNTKEPTGLKTQQDTENKSKEISPQVPAPVPVTPITPITNEPSASGVEKMSLGESYPQLEETQKASDRSATNVYEQKELQIIEPATETVRHTSRKRKKAMKANGRAKMLRRTVKPSSETPDNTNDDPSNDRSAADESNVRDKEPIVEQTISTDVVSQVNSSVAANVASSETEQMETRPHKPNVEDTERPIEQSPSTDVIGPAIDKSAVSPNVPSVGVGQMEIRALRPNARTTLIGSNVGNKEQSSSADVISPSKVATTRVEHMETRHRRPNVRTALNEMNVGGKTKRAEQSSATDVISPVRSADPIKADGIRVRQMEIRSRRQNARAALNVSNVADKDRVAHSSSKDATSSAKSTVSPYSVGSRPITRRTLKEKQVSVNKSKKERQSKKVSSIPAAVAPKVVVSFSRKSDHVQTEPTPPTPPPPPPPLPVSTNEVSLNDNIASASTSRTESVTDPELDLVRPKSEYIGEGQQYQQESTNSGKKTKFDVHPKNTSTNNASDTEVTVFELPSFIVMKTKIITRRDLRSGRAYIPPLVKQKFNKLAEERHVMPLLKTERSDFNDVCTEINSLLDQNANYLKFASGSERQARMNQVLADSSLSVEDAQCALKFLRSYLLPYRTKEVRDAKAKPRGQQFIPIYDSQRKIIGYRKRISNAKRSIDSTGRSVLQRLVNSSTRTTSPATSVVRNRNLIVPTGCEIDVVQRVIQFTTKKEPQVMDGGGNEEIIVPDVAPANEQCIKSEVDSILS